MPPLRRILVAFGLLTTAAGADSPTVSADAAGRIVAQIQKADYEDDRAALKRLHDALGPYVDSTPRASRILYWQGFALWRRAFNGFNDDAPVAELEADLTQAASELEKAAARDPSFVDASAGEISCLSNLMFLYRNDAERSRKLLDRVIALSKAALTAAPENPRLLWVIGANRWYTPANHGGGEKPAIETYEMGLAAARKAAPAGPDPLEPTWGEPELLMNLAWASLHAAHPDAAAAERYARAALAKVPTWHYVRDILLPQIQAAQKAQ